VNVQLLIDSIVRQVTVLIAQLATSGGVRAPVAHIADQVFVELSDELAAQGVSRKVSADMFGMALRAYIRKLQRLRESETQPGATLWQAVLTSLDRARPVTRTEVLEAFARDDEAQVRAVLHDLCESGLVFATGGGGETSYRAASEAELSHMRQHASGEGLDELLWALIYREGPLERDALGKRVRLDEPKLDAVLRRLCSSGRVSESGHGATARYGAQDFSVLLEARTGWEGAVFDHFQAMVQTITQRLREPSNTARAQDIVGGSTYSYDIWPGHPLQDEVHGALRAFRDNFGALLQRVQAHNQTHGRPAHYEQVVLYGGQCVLTRGDDDVREKNDD
jgi:hypothetical protein